MQEWVRADESILMVGLPALYHPIIEIGYGLEFGLPGLVPVALAQAAGSTDWLEVFFLKSESEARIAKVPRLLPIFVFQGIDIGSVKESGPGKMLKALLDEIYNDKKARGTAYLAETIPRKKLVADSLAGIISYAKQVRVPVDLINEKMIESINISGVFIASPIIPPPPSLPTGLKYFIKL